MTNEYEQFREYINEKNYNKASEMSFKNPELKKNLSKEELEELFDYYESQMKDIIIKYLKHANSDLNEMNSKLEKTIKEIVL